MCSFNDIRYPAALTPIPYDAIVKAWLKRGRPQTFTMFGDGEANRQLFVTPEIIERALRSLAQTPFA